jgi:hypothetical protein
MVAAERAAVPTAVTQPGAAPLRVRLIGKSNGVGLTRDFELLASALGTCHCSVTVQHCERRERRRRRALTTWVIAQLRRLQRHRHPGRAAWDVNIMLEHVWPQFLHEARCNVLVPNPEWFDRRDRSFLDLIDRVWVKSTMSEQLFRAQGRVTVRIGFDSEDRYLPDVVRRRECLHLAGRSPLKGTRRLLALWRRHPQWPMLTVIENDAMPDKSSALHGCANVTYQRGYLTDEGLRGLQNAHRFHVCPSEAEGWGHYIAEAMSIGALAITTDAPPMNELVTSERGILVKSSAGARHNLARLALFDEQALEQAIEHCLALNEQALDTLGAAARDWFLSNKHAFAGRIASALADAAVLARATA